jgi:diadenylate cyclase
MLNYTTQQTIIQMFRMFFDILILWVLLYYTIKIVRNNSRTAQIFKGIILILIIRAIANFFGFKAVDWLAGVLVTYGFLAIIIIFQPEIRSILEKLGKSSVFSRLNTLSVNERLKLVDELVNATMGCSQNKVGALITLEQGHSLSDFIKTGTSMNSIVTADLLQTIFMPTTPLHDGAVIIQGDRIACASAYFPPTNLEVPSRYGARHRAAIGISEITDSITIVVSEKSGRISIAEEGKLLVMTQQSLRSYLEQVILHDEEEVYHADPTKTLALVSKEEVEVPKPIIFKTKAVSDEPKKKESKFNLKNLLGKKKSNKEEVKQEKVEEKKEQVTQVVVQEELFKESNQTEVLEDVLDVVKKSLEIKRNETISSTSKKKRVSRKKVEDVSNKIDEVIINEPIDIKEENSELKQKQMPHVSLEYSVSDDTLLDDEDDVSKGGEQE